MTTDFPVVWRPRREWVLVGIVGVFVLGATLASEWSDFVAYCMVLSAALLVWATGASAVIDAEAISKRFFGLTLSHVPFPARLDSARLYSRLGIRMFSAWDRRSAMHFEKWFWSSWRETVELIQEANAAAIARANAGS